MLFYILWLVLIFVIIKYRKIIQLFTYVMIKIAKDKMLNTCIDTPNGKYVVTYYRHGKRYKIILPADKVLMKPKYFLCDKSKDITKDLAEYIGPNHDFHNQLYTPADLHQQKIIVFRDVDDTGIHVVGEEIIPSLL